MDETPAPLPPSIPAPPPPMPEAAVLAPVASPMRAPKIKVWNRPGFKTTVSVASIVITLATCVGLYARANNFGQQVVEAHPVDARIQFTNAPGYLDPRIVDALRQEAYEYAQQDQSNYDRARNPQDGTVLREIADLYTGTQQAQGYNAWIKSITSVRREVAKDKSIQTIQMTAQWRMPAAWVYAGEAFYLIDEQGIRLPGEYKAEDRRGSKLLVIAGMELAQTPVGQQVNGLPGPEAGMVQNNAHVPAPGEGWFGANGAVAADLAAGMKLAQMLGGRSFTPQINGIDVSNMGGRRDPMAAWILLQSIHTNAQGAPRVVEWGRPIGEEKFYEVKAETKLKNLTEVYQHFNQIDAGRDYVDIRTEVILLPKPLASGQ